MNCLKTGVKCNKLNVIDENGWMGLAIGHIQGPPFLEFDSKMKLGDQLN